MGIVSAVAIYFLVWWIMFFIVLPWSLVTQEDAGDIVLGTPPSAPAAGSHVPRALLVTTVFSAFVYALIHAALAWGWIDMWDLTLGRERLW